MSEVKYSFEQNGNTTVVMQGKHQLANTLGPESASFLCNLLNSQEAKIAELEKRIDGYEATALKEAEK